MYIFLNSGMLLPGVRITVSFCMQLIHMCRVSFLNGYYVNVILCQYFIQWLEFGIANTFYVDLAHSDTGSEVSSHLVLKRTGYFVDHRISIRMTFTLLEVTVGTGRLGCLFSLPNKVVPKVSILFCRG